MTKQEKDMRQHILHLSRGWNQEKEYYWQVVGRIDECLSSFDRTFENQVPIELDKGFVLSILSELFRAKGKLNSAKKNWEELKRVLEKEE